MGTTSLAGAGRFSRRQFLSAAAASGTGVRAAVTTPAGKLAVWDLHSHLTGFEGVTPRDRMAAMVRFADRMGVDRMCVFMGYPLQENPAPEALRAQNDQVLEAILSAPQRAFGIVYLNPNHLEFSLREFDRCVRDGPMVGV